MARTGTPTRERSTSTRADRTNGQTRRQEKTAKLTLEELVRQTKAGEVDTIIIAIADLQGRLMGKRLTGPYFLDHIDEGLHACDYLLAMDVDNEPLPGFKFTNWGTGYGDMHGHPDLSTIRSLPWLEKTALILCDVETMGGNPGDVAPRQILPRRAERARKLGFNPKTGSELEFYLFKDSFEQAAEKDYRNLQPYGRYIEDYHILQGTKTEWLNRLVRNGMEGAAVPVENSKGEWGFGQQEINLRFAESLEMADRHVVYKNGVKEIAALNQVAVTFMAKWSMAQAGSSFHLHSSLWDLKTDKALFHSANGGPHGMSTLFQHYLAGPITLARELLRAELDRWELRQPGLRLPHHWSRLEPARRMPHSRRRRQSLPGLRGDDRGRAARHREQAPVAARVPRRRVHGEGSASRAGQPDRGDRCAGQEPGGSKGLR